jgi:hypothetical protein
VWRASLLYGLVASTRQLETTRNLNSVIGQAGISTSRHVSGDHMEDIAVIARPGQGCSNESSVMITDGKEDPITRCWHMPLQAD